MSLAMEAEPTGRWDWRRMTSLVTRRWGHVLLLSSDADDLKQSGTPRAADGGEGPRPPAVPAAVLCLLSRMLHLTRHASSPDGTRSPHVLHGQRDAGRKCIVCRQAKFVGRLLRVAGRVYGEIQRQAAAALGRRRPWCEQLQQSRQRLEERAGGLLLRLAAFRRPGIA